jgi:hypothetical protein
MRPHTVPYPDGAVYAQLPTATISVVECTSVLHLPTGESFISVRNRISLLLSYKRQRSAQSDMMEGEVAGFWCMSWSLFNGVLHKRDPATSCNSTTEREEA